MSPLRAAILLAALCGTVLTGQQPPSRPNIIVFLADDQGWGDLGITGNTNLSTPRIDSIGRDGAVLQHFYVSPVCAPTRAELLTGRYYPRGGVYGTSARAERLNLDEKTIADALKAAGYATGAFGKWHNGSQSPYHPNARGFDEFYGITQGHWGHYFDTPMDHNGVPERGKGFIADDLTDRAMQFITRHRRRPFFAYIPFNTPHSPMQVPDRFYRRFAGRDLPLRAADRTSEDLEMTRAALAMVENIDWNVGRMLDHLDRLQLSRDTIVIYFSDNGPAAARWNGGLKGRKGSLDEGGIRSPFLIRWPGRIRPGTTIPQIASAVDLLPTLAGLAGIRAATREAIGRQEPRTAAARRVGTVAGSHALHLRGQGPGQRPHAAVPPRSRRAAVRSRRGSGPAHRRGVGASHDRHRAWCRGGEDGALGGGGDRYGRSAAAGGWRTPRRAARGRRHHDRVDPAQQPVPEQLLLHGLDRNRRGHQLGRRGPPARRLRGRRLLRLRARGCRVDDRGGVR